MPASLACVWMAVGCILATGGAEPKEVAPAAAAENPDRLPRYLAVLKNPPWPHTVHDALDRIAALNDDCAVAPVAELLTSSRDLFVSRHACRTLGKIKSPASTKALIDALSIDFQAVADGKHLLRDNNRLCRNEIAGLLRARTRQDFGTDQAKWREWYAKEYPAK